MKGAFRRARRKAGAIRQRLFESPEQAAWRRAWHLVETTPRFTPGRIKMMEYDLRYSDPQLLPAVAGHLRQADARFSAASPGRDCVASTSASPACSSAAIRMRAHRVQRSGAFALLDANLSANGAQTVERKNRAVDATGSLTFRSEGSDSG